jgi:hypothetical protein
MTVKKSRNVPTSRLVSLAGTSRVVWGKWNDGPTKQAIVDFVHASTETGGAKFVLPEERIATFDQDGTLWVEHPIYWQLIYCLDRVPVLVREKAGIKERRTIQNCALRRP